ncbi:ras guanine nucleotide exchange factor i-related [Anaeramoeba flamelloides]|uniref:Ras guanine nucleotide exchange factor i-related n=1 Tax=Anaeramoeba flamelloides TaxID=1746091 RepID=A0AAV8A8X5_9EUKA|nr:ras guanine nucleotide exchange factor i-related [Anaeramoeba flamelloides]
MSNAEITQSLPTIGDKIKIKGNQGIVKFVGKTRFSSGTWVGCEFERNGNKQENGTRDGIKYFECKNGSGYFFQFQKKLNRKKKKKKKKKKGRDKKNTKEEDENQKKKKKKKSKKKKKNKKQKGVCFQIIKESPYQTLLRKKLIHHQLLKLKKQQKPNYNQQTNKNEKEIKIMELKKRIEELKKEHQHKTENKKETEQTVDLLKNKKATETKESLNSQLESLINKQKKIEDQTKFEIEKNTKIKKENQVLGKQKKELIQEGQKKTDEIQIIFKNKSQNLNQDSNPSNLPLKKTILIENITQMENKIKLLKKQIESNEKKIEKLKKVRITQSNKNQKTKRKENGKETKKNSEKNEEEKEEKESQIKNEQEKEKTKQKGNGKEIENKTEKEEKNENNCEVIVNNDRINEEEKEKENKSKTGSTNNLNIDKSEWAIRLMKKRPHIFGLREKIRPISKKMTYGKIPTIKKVLNPNFLNSSQILQLIMQHYDITGKSELKDFIEKQTGIDYIYQEVPESILITLIRLAIKEDVRIVDITQEFSENQNPDEKDLSVSRNIILSLDDDDINVWDEAEDDEKNIVVDKEMIDEYKNGNYIDFIHTSNVNNLIKNLINEKYLHENFVQTFLMTYHGFLKPEHLFLKVVQRYKVPPMSKCGVKFENEREYKLFKIGIQRNSINFLETWINNQFFDFGRILLSALRSFIQNKIKKDWPKDYQVLLQTIHMNKNKKVRMEMGDLIKTSSNNLQTITFPEPIIPKNVFSHFLNLRDVKEIEFARQITLYVQQLFQKIQPSELVNQAWSKSKLKHKAKNVINIIQKFNDFSKYFAEQIVSEKFIKQRAAQFIRWIKITTLLREMNNFDTVLAIVAAIGSSACSRLKFSQNEVSVKLWKNFDLIRDSLTNDHGYKIYRQMLEDCELPAIPYLGVYLTDLTFISDGSPDTIDGLINFSKRKLLFNVIKKIKKFQSVSYNFIEIFQITKLLKKRLSTATEKSLYLISVKHEPRGVQRGDLI